MGQRQRARSLIAIVDDDKSVRQALVRLVGAHSFRAKGYASAREFLASLEIERPDCLVLDLQMPDMTGLQLLQLLAAREPKTPTIVVTASDQAGMEHRCRLAGAAVFFLKPVSGETLVRAIQKIVTRERIKHF